MKENIKSNRIAIWIPGQPARVTHQSGTRYAGGRTYKTKALRNWEEELAEKLEVYIPEKPLDGPVVMSATFGYQTSEKKKHFTWKTTKPDTDNSIKTVKDTMTKLGFWQDDAQVVFETVKKIWVPDSPGIVITVEELAGAPGDWRIANVEGNDSAGTV